ncbi:MAG: SpoVG family protein [Planctomycetes bacterium]|jgi:stage V sporulation protein G|nr:SpoVG family protein [Planctomycetota bacterium]MCC7066226.1 SpoVG family protein [Planctomycetota bacterium]
MQNESDSGSGNTSNTNGATRFLVTEVRVKLTDDPRNKLKAYCSVTIDDAFVVRDLKIIEGNKGPFVAMPSRKLADHCQRCHHKNHLRACFCNQCGSKLDPDRAPRDSRGRARLHADLAHPINSQTRIELHKAVVRAYAEEIEAARAAGEAYRPKTFDDLDVLSDSIDDEYLEELERRQEERERRRQLDREAAVGRDGMAAGGAG